MILTFGVFQLTASQGGWPYEAGICSNNRTFQLTASQGGWRASGVETPRYWHFNSQPHKEADVVPRSWKDTGSISTHSLTRRLTAMWGLFRLSQSISTHSLTRRLTQVGGRKLLIMLLFQLTASQGGWQHLERKQHFSSRDFNSQPHKEADVKAQSLTKTLMTFQLTASQGGWHRRDDPVLPLPAISTHSLTRRLTALMECMILTILISTHSLTRRLTNTTYTSQIYMTISTHSLTRRLTGNQAEFDRRVQISTHSLTRRLTNFRNSNGA